MPSTGLTLLFDSRCHLCWRSRKWLESRQEPPGSLRFVSIYDDVALAALPVTDPTALQGLAGQMRAVDATGRIYAGAAAIAQGLQRCGWPWRLLGRLLALPWVVALAQPVYGLVAANRHRWLPPLSEAEEQALFDTLSVCNTNVCNRATTKNPSV